MHKLYFFLFVVAAPLLGSDGYEIFKRECQQCHIELISKKDALKNFKKLQAPPMVEVSNRLKENIIIADDDEDVKQRVIIAFIKDYIDNPAVEATMCNPMAVEKFGVMPSLKGKLSEEEKQAVAQWIYNRYEDVEFE